MNYVISILKSKSLSVFLRIRNDLGYMSRYDFNAISPGIPDRINHLRQLEEAINILEKHNV